MKLNYNIWPIFSALFFCFLTINFALAQEILLENASKKGLRGVRIMDKNGYYIQFAEKVEDSDKKEFRFRFVILNNELKETSEFFLILPPREEIEDVCFNGGMFFLASSNKKNKNRTFRLLDQTGNQKAMVVKSDLKKSLLSDPISVLPLENTEFLIINYIKDKNFGYSLEKFNSNLETVYEEVYIPEKKQIDPIDYGISGNVLFLLEYMTQNVGNFFEFDLVGYDINTGKELFKHQLKSQDDEANGYASFMKITPKGNAVTAGLYFKGNTDKDNSSPGFFGASVSPEGVFNFEYKSWDAVKDRMADHGKLFSWAGPKSRALLQDVVGYDDGSFSLIGEVFTVDGFKVEKPASSSTTGSTGSTQSITNYRFSVRDFIVMDFDKDANFTESRVLIKPEYETIVKPPQNSTSILSSQSGPINMARILNNYGVMPYQFSVDRGENRYVVHTYRHSEQFKQELYFSDIKSGKQKGPFDVTQRYLERNRDFVKKMDATFGMAMKYAGQDYDTETNIFYMDSRYTPWNTRAKIENSRIFPSNVEGKIIMYDLIPTPETEADEKALKKWIQMYEYKAEGNLKVWYVDVPE